MKLFFRLLLVICLTNQVFVQNTRDFKRIQEVKEYFWAPSIKITTH